MAKTATELEGLRREIERLKKELARLKLKNSQHRDTARKRRAATPRARKWRAHSRTFRVDRRLRHHFGEVDLGAPLGADNETIDRDLAREYARNHQDG